MFGWIKAALGVAANLVTFFSKNKKPSLTEVIPVLVANLIPAVNDAISYQGLDTKTKIDTWLAKLDEMTGTDPGAVNFDADMPPAAQEEMFDGLLTFVRVYAYHRAGVPGYKA